VLSTRSFHQLHALFISAACGILSALVPGAIASVVDVTSPTTSWTPVQYTNNDPDPSSDQQTGTSEGDLVGNAAHPSFYTQFGNAGTPSFTDGTLAFRARVGADVNPVGFKTALFVGIDANNDGALDLFVGVNNSGSADTVGIWNPGTGANTSPSTTSIVSVPLLSYTPVAANYHFAAVTLTIDPSVGTATDIDGGGQNDYFLSFAIPFNDIVTQLGLRGISGVNENSTFSYVMATATQANSLNQDLNGLPKTYDGTATWGALGALSNPLSASGLAVVPEPGAGLVVGLFSLVALATRRRCLK
jgi:hypothetical protein